MYIWTIQMLIKIHFQFVGTCHKDYNLTKGLRNISFKKDFFHEILHIQKDNHNEQ
jgi:hypothetical protein